MAVTEMALSKKPRTPGKPQSKPLADTYLTPEQQEQLDLEAMTTRPAMGVPENGAWIGGIYYSAEQLAEAAAEEAAEAAASSITPDFFDYLRSERNDFIRKFWDMHGFHGFDAKDQVWAENMIIAFDQMFEIIGLIYFQDVKRELPTSTEEEWMERTVKAMFNDLSSSKPATNDTGTGSGNFGEGIIFY